MGLKSKYTDETLAGWKINHLTFVRILERRPHTIVCEWNCDCGKSTTGNLYLVRRGNKKTCGCYMTMKRENNPRWSGVGEMPGHYWNHLTFGAKKRGLELGVTKEYLWELFLKQEKKCALTGEPLKFHSRWDAHDGTASLDRIDSDKGYVVGNVQWVHQDVNYMKQDFSTKYFLSLCEKICKHNASVLELAYNSG